MEIFKEAHYHRILKDDLAVASYAWGNVKSHTADKAIEDLVGKICDEIFLNLTDEAATVLADLSERNPECEAEWLVEFLVWRNKSKVEPVKDFIERTSHECIDEDVVCSVRVYPGDFFIEMTDDEGSDTSYCLTLENQSWSSAETTLETMELELFKFAQGEGG